MGIYIKGMGMPKSCSDCEYLWFSNIYQTGRCGITEKLFDGYMKERSPDCPMIHISAHGELIDRDSFIDFIKTHWDSSDQWFIDQLEARPVVIPEGKDGAE